MKILHLLGPFMLPPDPTTGGVSGVVRVALEIARTQVTLGHEVSVVAVGEEAWEAEWSGVKLAQLKPARWARLRINGRTLDFRVHLPYVLLTRRERFDIAQGHLYNYLRFLRANLRITHIHSDPFHQSSPLESPMLTAADLRLIGRNTQAQVAVSQFIAGRLRLGLGTMGNVHVVYNGVDAEHFDPARWCQHGQELRAQWGVRGGEVVFLYAGAIVPAKGVLHLARAFDRLADELPGIHLALAGSSALWDENFRASEEHRAYEREVRAALERAQSRGRVHFLGQIGAAEMPQAYAASDVVVVPSVWCEAFGLVAVEALASARSVIASDIGGLPEIVNEGNGALVPPGDERSLQGMMRTLGQDPDRRRRLGLSGRAEARRFSWGRAARALEAIYAANLREKGWR